MDQTQRKNEIREALERARDTTLRLFECVPEPYFKVRVHDFYSPIGWHFGHIGMTEEFWVATRALGRLPEDAGLAFLFANLPDNPKDNRVHLPDTNAILAYLERTRRRTLTLLESTNLDTDDPLSADGYAWEFAYRHECQHQETITELLQLITKWDAPPVRDGRADWPAPAESEMVSLPGGEFTMGSDDRHGYDNEKHAHTVRVEPFELDRTPVTAAQWMQFIEAGGYTRPELWTAAGWRWAEENRVARPEYWHPFTFGAGFGYYGPFGSRDMHPEEPVSSLSWFEADAYARWIGKRLPTEAEWEFAAAFDPASGRSRRYPWGDPSPTADRACFGLAQFQPGPVGRKPAGASAFGLLDMAGSVWEWTASPFLPYPGFEAFPYDGYSRDHMDGMHYVCRGGSWATAAPILRGSFRNWYVPTYRQGFLGLRCAR